jgi:hypothetical protein
MMDSFDWAGMLRDGKIGHGTEAVNRHPGAVEMCGMFTLGDNKFASCARAFGFLCCRRQAEN